MASEVASWQPAPTGDYLHDHDPQGNGLNADGTSMTQPYRMVGKHGQVYDPDPQIDPCRYPNATNADDPNIGNASGVNPGPFAKG